ncbi:large ribosomal subunit protein mL37 [Neosynchiropus ocellatus]
MGKSMELSQDLRSLIVAQHQNGTGYRLISKNLSIPVCTVGPIIRKWKKHHLIINRPCTGAPRKISDQGVRKMVRRVLKEPRTTREALQKDMEAAVGTVLSPPLVLRDAGLLAAHGRGVLLARRPLSRSSCLTGKMPPPWKTREKVEIPGLEMITYGERMHYVPGLAKPVFPKWEREEKDPFHYRSPPHQEMPLYKEKPCYMFHQRTSILEGLVQALWLTKTKLTTGLPAHILSPAVSLTNQIADQDERVQNAIRHARFWDTTEERPKKDVYGLTSVSSVLSKTLLLNLLHLCGALQATHPSLRRRMFSENYSLSTTWTRGENLFQIRGLNGLLHTSMDPLPQVSEKQEVLGTANEVLETFYPVSPTIDLQEVHLYKEVNCTVVSLSFVQSGFSADCPYPHAHTLYFLEDSDTRFKLKPEQFRAKMMMFAFGNALARAYARYGQTQSVLDQPITVQAIGSNGRIFQFLVFQLNTTDLTGDDGVKNQVWLDEDVELYDFAKVRPYIKKKEVRVPAGLKGYKPETFNKFLALYLNGAV